MTRGYQPGPVADFASDGRNRTCPTVLVEGVEVVVLDTPERHTVRALRLGRIVHLDAGTIAVPVTHPPRQTDMLRDAVAGLHRLATDRANGGRRALAALDTFRANLRGYMVHQFRQGELDRSTLNQFLRRFDLDPCDAPVRVHYTLAGSVEIDVFTGDGVDRSSFTVGPDLDAIDLLVDGPGHHDALVKIYPSVPVGLVTYTVTGRYDVTAPHAGDAVTTACSYLHPDLSHLVGVREDTGSFRIDVRTEVRFNA